MANQNTNTALSNFDIGRRAESTALDTYNQLGYSTLGVNVRKSAGEIDLIVAKGRTVVFVEVKYRSSQLFGLPVEAVGKKKQQRIRGAAAEWLTTSQRRFSDLRFDVAAVDRDFRVELYKDAF